MIANHDCCIHEDIDEETDRDVTFCCFCNFGAYCSRHEHKRQWVCKWCGTLNMWPGNVCDYCSSKRFGSTPR